MSALPDRLQQLFDEGHRHKLEGLCDEAAFAPPQVREAAVLIAVTDRTEPGVILTHRPASMREHAGEVCFPGGKVEPGEDPIVAALREAYEELALEPRRWSTPKGAPGSKPEPRSAHSPSACARQASLPRPSVSDCAR